MPISIKPTVVSDKGTQLMKSMLLPQYQGKENLLEYFSVFFEELDLLFSESEEVYLGRMLEFAEGSQLDVIGLILDQGRSVPIAIEFFGFDGALNAAQMADEATPADGGVFRSENQSDSVIFPLDDTRYRNMLLAKALSNASETTGVEELYLIVSTLLGRVPRLMQVNVPAARQITLNISAIDTSDTDVGVLEYFAQYMVPLGTSFDVVRI